MNLFIFGSIDIVKLDYQICFTIDKLLKESPIIIVGDAAGVDSEVQKLMITRKYTKVIVYHSGDRCRNNIGKFFTKKVPANGLTGRDFYTAKDIVMCDKADKAIAIWNGISKGTKSNIERLQKANKEIIIFNRGIKNA